MEISVCRLADPRPGHELRLGRGLSVIGEVADDLNVGVPLVPIGLLAVCTAEAVQLVLHDGADGIDERVQLGDHTLGGEVDLHAPDVAHEEPLAERGILHHMVQDAGQYGAVVDDSPQVGVDVGVESHAVVGVHDGEVPLGVHGGVVGVGIAPDLDVIAWPVGAAEIDLGAVLVDETVQVDAVGDILVIGIHRHIVLHTEIDQLHEVGSLGGVAVGGGKVHVPAKGQGIGAFQEGEILLGDAVLPFEILGHFYHPTRKSLGHYWSLRNRWSNKNPN